jgi:hypothetical protein
VIGQGTLGGKIVLYLQANPAAMDVGTDTLIAIQTHTGFIGAFPVGPSSNLYQYVEDGAPGGF